MKIVQILIKSTACN